MKQVEIIYEDKKILILNKPKGMVTTKEGGDVGTIQDWLLDQFSWSKKVVRAGIAHRLDKGTSGILVVAKDNDSLNFLKRQFKNRSIYKEYLALIEGEVSYRGEIKVPIGRSKYSFLKWAVDVDGKEAWTKFERVKVYEKEGKKYSLVKIVLKTGRTHQIRVHFSYLSWPLVGDSLYGGKRDLIARPFLHSKKIKLMHPDEHEFECEAEISQDLKYVLDEL